MKGSHYMIQSDLLSSGGEESDGGNKRARTPDRPSSRKNSPQGKSKKSLQVFIVKVYDLVESKEAINSVVVRDYDKLLEELIEEHRSFAVCDYFKPQSLDWWAKALRQILITFDKPNGELCVVVDKKLIRRLVSQKMSHHVWMDQALTPDQQEIQHKMLLEKSRKLRSKAKLRASMEMTVNPDMPAWDDFNQLGERNAGASFRGPSGMSAKSAKFSSSSSASGKQLPPVRSAKSLPPQPGGLSVGDWVEGNFKRAGQWYSGIVRRVHKDCEYYDVDYDDGRSETRVEAKLVRPCHKNRSCSGSGFDGADALDLVDGPESRSHAQEEGFSPGADADGGDGFGEQSWAESSYNEADPGEQSYATEAHYGDPSVYTQDESNVDYTSHCSADEGPYHSSAFDSAAASAEGGVWSAVEEDAPAAVKEPEELRDATKAIDASESATGGDSHAYDYTNEAIIQEDGAIERSGAAKEEGPEEEVADSAELIAIENSNAARKVATPYVEELISSVMNTNYPVPAPPSSAPRIETVGEGFAEHFSQAPPSPLGMAGADEVENAPAAPLAGFEATPQRDEEHGTVDAERIEEETSAALENLDASAAPEETAVRPGDDTRSTKQPAFLGESNSSPGFKSSPSKIALASLMRTLSIEDVSAKSSATKSVKTATKRKKLGESSVKKVGKSSSAILLGSSQGSTEKSAPKVTGPPTTAGAQSKNKKGKKASSIAMPKAPEGLFASPTQNRRAKTASTAPSAQPPSIDEYVAAAAAAGTVASHRVVRASTAAAGSPAAEPRHLTAQELLKNTAAIEDDAHSMHSQHSLDSMHSMQSYHTHFTVDSHGNFHHKDVPHYPLPHASREEATKAAYEAILKPHSNPQDRYTYTAMPAPIHLTVPVSHHYGYGPKHDHHDGRDQHHHHSPRHHGAHPNGHGEFTEDYIRALSPASLMAHNEKYGHHPLTYHMPHKELHFPHHDHDFFVSTSIEQPTHRSEHSIFSESRSHGHSSPVHPHHSLSHPHSHAGSWSGINSPLSVSSTSSLPPTYHSISKSASRSRPVTPTRLEAIPDSEASVDGDSEKNPTSATAPPSASSTAAARTGAPVTSSGATITSLTSAATLGNGSQRPRSKAGARAQSPFTNKERYHGPQRRVLDIIEWARISVGGSPKRQNRKISAVEQRLMKR